MKHTPFVEGITTILAKRNVIRENEAEALIESFKHSEKPYYDDFLLSEGIVDKDDLLSALSEYFQVPSFDAVGYFFDNNLVRMFPKEFLRSNVIIPIEVDENMLIVLAGNPHDPELPPRINNFVSYDIYFRVGIRQDIDDAIQEYYDASVAQPENFDDVYDETREVREDEIAQEKEIEELTYENYERDE